MSPKVFALLFVCVVIVAVEGAYPEEETRDEHQMTHERCDENFCGDDVHKCHRCCHDNFHFDYEDAGDDVEKQHAAVDKMCSCYHKVNGHGHHD